MPTPEAIARETIDAQLGAAGWGVQNVSDGDRLPTASCGFTQLALNHPSVAG